MGLGDESERESRPEPVELPVEVEIYIEADGSVTFADLAADVAPIARELNPEEPPACEPTDRPAGSSASGTYDADGQEGKQDD